MNRHGDLREATVLNTLSNPQIHWRESFSYCLFLLYWLIRPKRILSYNTADHKYDLISQSSQYYFIVSDISIFYLPLL